MTVQDVTLRQGCTDLDTGIVDLAAECQNGQQPLFSRPPLEVTASVDGQDFVILVNHFKSKRGGAEETTPRRIAQAAHVRRLVEEVRSSTLGTYAVVLGDFNDYAGSDVMDTLQEGGILLDALRDVPADSRYSYVFDGASQLIDWILVSPGLVDFVDTAGILHVNADFPFMMSANPDPSILPLRSSDHDVPYIVLDLEPEVESTAAAPTATLASSFLPDPSPTSVTAEPTYDPAQAVLREQDPGSDGRTPESPLPHPALTRQAQAEVAENERPSQVLIWVLMIVGVVLLVMMLAALNVLRQRR